MSELDSAAVLSAYSWATASPTRAAVVAATAQLGIGLLPLVLLALWWAPGRARAAGRRAATASCLAAAVAVGIVIGLDVVGGLGRARPFVALALPPLLSHAADASFPSDHALVGAALAWPLIWRRQRAGLACMTVTLVVGAARVAAGLHFPSDVLGSVALAVAPAAGALSLLRRIDPGWLGRWTAT